MPRGSFRNTSVARGNSLQKHFDRHPLLMPVELKAVDGRIVLIFFDGFLRDLQVGGAKGLEQAFGQDDAFAREIAE